MVKYPIKPQVDSGIFKGLAKQNLLFHNALGELIDNSIAASQDKECVVHVHLLQKSKDSNILDLYVSDNSEGMGLKDLERALGLGHPPQSSCRLNEHGFGLKNSLATLTGGERKWKIWTRKKGEKKTLSVEGPFALSMEVDDDEEFPSMFSNESISTVVYTQISLEYLQTVQRVGRKGTNLSSLRSWIVEHLGVMYRGYLTPVDGIKKLTLILHTIYENGNEDIAGILPIEVPYATRKTEHFKLNFDGEVVDFEYNHGTLDPIKRDVAVSIDQGKDRCMYYYQGNQATQGIDIRIEGRTIATMQFNEIFVKADGDYLSRHNNFNDFVGELIVPKLKRGLLSTVNNKSNFNLSDRNWSQVFDKLNEYRPPEKIRETTETGLKNEWAKRLKAANPEDEIDTEHCVWQTGTKIDVFRKDEYGKITIYELKVGTVDSINVYQLKMYWDGLVLEGIQPTEAILLVGRTQDVVESMVKVINDKMIPPKIMDQGKIRDSNPYRFKIKTHKDVGLE